jgi:hypothetical protein
MEEEEEEVVISEEGAAGEEWVTAEGRVGAELDGDMGSEEEDEETGAALSPKPTGAGGNRDSSLPKRSASSESAVASEF